MAKTHTSSPSTATRAGGNKLGMPQTDEFEVGMELEGTFGLDNCPRVGGYGHRNGVGLPTDIYKTYDPDGENKPWLATYDSTIRTRGRRKGVEVVSPKMKGEKAFQSILDTVGTLKEQGFSVNSSTGLHIHVGLSSIVGDHATVDDTVAFLATLKKYVWNVQDALYASTGTRRDRGQWCRPLLSTDNIMDLVRQTNAKAKGTKTESDFRRVANNADRYRVLNITRLQRGREDSQATLEFRFMAATLNPSKIMFHFTSIMFLIRLAWQNRHTEGGNMNWTPKSFHREVSCRCAEARATAGRKALRYLIARMNNKNAGYWMKGDSPIIKAYWEKGQRWATKMAEKYDARVAY